MFWMDDDKMLQQLWESFRHYPSSLCLLGQDKKWKCLTEQVGAYFTCVKLEFKIYLCCLKNLSLEELFLTDLKGEILH